MATYQTALGEFAITIKKNMLGKGIHMHIEFNEFVPEPGSIVALIQATRATKAASLSDLKDPKAEKQDFPSTAGGARNEQIWTAARWAIDAPGEERRCPIFGIDFLKRDYGVSPAEMWRRWCEAEGANGRIGKFQGNTRISAMLDDKPRRGGWASTAGNPVAFHHEFEVLALRLQLLGGSIVAKGLGALTWGYSFAQDADQKDGMPDFPEARNIPSGAWIAAAQHWNFAHIKHDKIPGKIIDWQGYVGEVGPRLASSSVASNAAASAHPHNAQVASATSAVAAGVSGGEATASASSASAL
jgi:hypothetical protein